MYKILQSLHSFQITSSEGPENGKTSYSRTRANSTDVTETGGTGLGSGLQQVRGPSFSEVRRGERSGGWRARPGLQSEVRASSYN